MNFAQESLPASQKTPTDQFVDNMEMLSIIDVGTIKSINAAGRATVQSSRIIGTGPVIFTDVEVIGIGNSHGGFIADGTGNACLILVPRANMPDVSSLQVNWSSLPFSKDGVKALPITNGASCDVTTGFTSEGTLYISTKGYNIAFSTDLVSFTKEGFSATLKVSSSSLQLFRHTNNSGTLLYTIDDEGIYFSMVNKDGDSKYVFQLSDDGSLNISHVQPGSSQDTVLNEFKVAKDGTMTISLKKDLKIETEGDMQLVSKGDMSISADKGLKLKAQNNATLSCSSFNVNNGNLEVS